MNCTPDASGSSMTQCLQRGQGPLFSRTLVSAVGMSELVISGSGEPFAKSPFIPQQRTSRPPCIAGVRSARSARCSGRCQERSQFSRVSCRRRTAVSRAAQSSIGIDTVRKRAIIRTVDTWGARKIMAKSHLKLVAPTTEKRTVATPRRRPNAETADARVPDRG